jgi:hypothetical protein
MKSHLVLLLLLPFLFGACEEEKPYSPTGFIKAKVNGFNKQYHTLSDEDGAYGNWRTKTAIYITYLKEKGKSEYWTISIYFPDTTTLQNMHLPYEIKGPNPDFTGSSPEFHTMIIDPAGAPYGKFIAGGSSFDHDFSLTITYFQNNMIRGKFNGTGDVTFTNGEFAARVVPMK